jgi:hypothetical protein
MASKNLVAADSEIINDIAFPDDAWIRQRTQSHMNQKSPQKIKSLTALKSSAKLLPT